MTPPKILIIDDEIELANLISKTLKKEGYDVTTFYEGKGAVEEVRRLDPDVILLDIILPDISGLEILDLLKQDSRLKVIPVIIFSALVQSGDPLLAKAPAVELVGKPFEADHLLKTIRRALALR